MDTVRRRGNGGRGYEGFCIPVCLRLYGGLQGRLDLRMLILWYVNEIGGEC